MSWSSGKIWILLFQHLKEAGYDPYEQLEGYVQTGQDYYITRINDARNLIKNVERDMLLKYVDGFAQSGEVPRCITIIGLQAWLHSITSTGSEDSDYGQSIY